MISIDEMEYLLDELSQELPQEFYKDLNGGILLLPEARISPEARQNDLYTLGLYRYSHSMGRYITIYYGSFARIFGHLSTEELKEQLRETLYHEFTHHMESLAGERGLEKKDEEFMRKYHESGYGYRSPRLRKE